MARLGIKYCNAVGNSLFGCAIAPPMGYMPHLSHIPTSQPNNLVITMTYSILNAIDQNFTSIFIINNPNCILCI